MREVRAITLPLGSVNMALFRAGRECVGVVIVWVIVRRIFVLALILMGVAVFLVGGARLVG